MTETHESCTCPHCGVEFASPVVPQRCIDGLTFFCPNGHALSFTEVEVVHLKKALQQQRIRREEATRHLEWATAQVKVAKAKLESLP